MGVGVGLLYPSTQYTRSENAENTKKGGGAAMIELTYHIRGEPPGKSVEKEVAPIEWAT